MKKALLIASALLIAVVTTACINNIAVQELNNKAAEYMEKGDYESAVNRLQASIDLDATLFETHYNLGIAATNAEKYDLAIEAFQNGLKIKPDYNNFYYSLAIAQNEFANKLDENEDIDLEGKKQVATLKHQALTNLKEYLAKEPNANDKEDVESLIVDIDKYLKEQMSFPNKLKMEG